MIKIIYGGNFYEKESTVTYSCCNHGSWSLCRLWSTGAKKQKTETKKDNGKGYEDCTLKMDWWGGDSRHEATQNAVKGFMQKYPGINVEVNFGA